MTTQRNILECCSLLEYDGQVFIGLFPHEKLLYSFFSDEDGYIVWEVLDCQNCLDLLAAYLLGKATLWQIYQEAPRGYEQELPSGDLIAADPPSGQEPPFEESLLYHPATHVFNLAFPDKDPNNVTRYCNREKLFRQAVLKRLGESEILFDNIVNEHLAPFKGQPKMLVCFSCADPSDSCTQAIEQIYAEYKIEHVYNSYYAESLKKHSECDAINDLFALPPIRLKGCAKIMECKALHHTDGDEESLQYTEFSILKNEKRSCYV